MNSTKRKLAAWVAALAILAVTAGCTSDEQGAESAASGDNTAATSADTIASRAGAGQNDISWDASTATNVALNGAGIEVSGSGASAQGGVLTISKGGTYVLSGTLTDGQVVVNAPKTDTVKLVLNGADITSGTNAAIYASQVDNLTIILADGTQNIVTDAQSYTYADTAAEEPDAAIFCKNDMTIGGGGSLTVNASFYNGIGTKDDLVILGGTYNITAANHGIRGRDSLTVLDGSFTINAGNDGLQSNNDKDTAKGWISLEGGSYNITAAHDGIQAETVLSVSGGEYNILCGGGSTATPAASADSTESDSCKGLKAGGDLAVSGGTFDIDSADDAIHSNANIAISGGTFTLASGDDGIHADADLSVTGGRINITRSYEGLEGATMTIADGVINIVATDDAINAAGGNDGDAQPGRFGKDSFASAGAYYVNITGGEITFTAGGDGIDSNGDITISGGTITALIHSTPDNGALDCDGTLTVTGGTIVYGGTGVGRTPGSDSAQSYIHVSDGVSAGAEISIQKDGATLFSFTPAIDCQYLAFSSPDITSGESYEVYSGGSLLATAEAGTGGSGMGMGGRGGGGGGMRGDMGTPPSGDPRAVA